MLLLYILAALSYTIPFIFPTYCFFLIFFFPGLLFLLLTRYKVSYQSLGYWALATMCIQVLPLCNALLHMASGTFLLRIIPSTLLIMYVTIYPLVWLCFMRFLLPQLNLFHQYISWIISVWLYLLIMDEALFWILGRCEGYIFINPLLPLAAWPALLIFIGTVPWSIALLWFAATSTMIIFCLNPTTPRLFILIVLLAPFLCGLYMPIPPQSSAWYTHIGHLPLLLPHSINGTIGTLLVHQELDRLAGLYPSLTTIIMPESSWNSDTLSSVDPTTMNHPTIKNIIIGGFAQHQDAYFNRIYFMHKGHIQYHYDKRHAVPLTERITGYMHHVETSLFFQKSPPILPSTAPKKPLLIPDIGLFIPYICSELFCNTHPDDAMSYPIICLVNDWWFQMPHFQQLMALAARLQALKWHRPILYISFYYAQFFDQYGTSIPIITTPLDRYIR